MSEPLSLRGRFVHLLPMRMAHVDDLVAAATEERSTFAYTAVPSDTAAMAAYVTNALAARDAGQQYPFVTYGVEVGRIVGTTRFYEIQQWDWSAVPVDDRADRHDHDRHDHDQHGNRLDTLHIGHTWLSPAAQRTPVNTEAKLLMLAHAFDVWGVRAVRIQTDARNNRSRRAIERLGCHLDGVLRAERPATDGTVRDTATFSMLASEWPTNRQRLEARLTSA